MQDSFVLNWSADWSAGTYVRPWWNECLKENLEKRASAKVTENWRGVVWCHHCYEILRINARLLIKTNQYKFTLSMGHNGHWWSVTLQIGCHCVIIRLHPIVASVLKTGCSNLWDFVISISTKRRNRINTRHWSKVTWLLSKKST